jgi:hypothetical protein
MVIATLSSALSQPWFAKINPPIESVAVMLITSRQRLSPP